MCLKKHNRQIQMIEKYILSRQGTTLTLPWPSDWRLTLRSVQSLAGIFSEDLDEWCKLYLCCEKKLTVLGILHHVKKNNYQGPIVLIGIKGHVYIYNNIFDNALYYVARDIEEFFTIGLKKFYPIYGSVDIITNYEYLNEFLQSCSSFEDCLKYRDKNLGKGVLLNTTPYKTYLRFCNVWMLRPSFFIYMKKWKLQLQTELLDVIFIANCNFLGRWQEIVILINGCGQLFAIDTEHQQVIYLARNMEELLKMGCLRFRANTRMFTKWFLDNGDYKRNTEEKFSRKLSCPFGFLCKRKLKLTCCFFLKSYSIK